MGGPLCDSHASSWPCRNATVTNMHRLQCQSQALLDPELIEEIDRGSDTFQQQTLSQATALACRAAVGAIVREKELRLREGMRILGLKVSEPVPANSKEVQPQGENIGRLSPFHAL